MEEKQDKKKKIGKIIKYIGFSIILVWTIILGIIGCKKEVHGLSYSNWSYTHIINVSTQNYEGIQSYDQYYDIYPGVIQVIAYWDTTGGWANGNNPNNPLDYELKIQKVLDITDGLGISRASFTTGTYLVQVLNGSIVKATTIGIYNEYNGTYYTNQGFTQGVDATNETARQQGWNEGYNQGINQGQIIVNDTITQYEATIDSLNDDIAYYQGIINNGTTPWGSFQSLLGTIFLFPVKFFKEGFDVDIFGVNVGGFIIGLGMIGITLTIIGAILGRRSTT